MCGLVAYLRWDGGDAEQAQLKRMTDIIRHRGPDDDGYFLAGPVGLGFRRLSILDLSPAGHQPMTLAEAGVTLVFNGEIYNFVELRQELEALGHQFRSSGDSEVLLHAYLEWGQDCVNRLNGMWAFVIHDRRSNSLFGSRDRFGVKPLFRHQARGQMLFASEIKAIRASGVYQCQTNWQVAAGFLLHGQLDSGSATFYQDIVQVGAGCAFTVGADGAYREWAYWSLQQGSGRTVADPAAAYAELFEDAVRLNMRSDVPVAVHLSGGLDSSAIICASARIRDAGGATDPLMAFCFTAEEFDESEYIAATVAQTGARMEQLNTSARDIWDGLPRMLWHQDEPVHSMTAAVSYQLMRLTAARGLKVVLNGQGADETAAGYPSYFTHYWHSMLRSGNILGAWREIGLHGQTHGNATAPVFLQQLKFLARVHLAQFSGYRALSARRAAQRVAANPWISPEIARHLAPPGLPPDYRLQPVLADAVRRAPLPLYLRVEDRNSSAHSIEARVPFLDHRLVELLFSLPDNWRMRGPWNKYIQREAMRGRIPEVVRSRTGKMGFPTPSQSWFAGPLYEPLRELLGSQASRERGLYDVDAVLANLDRHRRGDAALTAPVFHLAQFELWCRMNEQPAEAAPALA